MQIQLYGKRFLVCRTPVNFNKSIDGLSALIMGELKENPQQNVYLFFNRRKDKVKILSYHRNGFVLLYKRLDKNRFVFDFKNDSGIIEVNADELGWLLAGLEWQKMRGWKELSYDKFS